MVECVPPQRDILQKWSDTLCQFITFILGVPKGLIGKSMLPRPGVGIGRLPTLVPIRVLDCVYRYMEDRHLMENHHAHVWYRVAAQALGGTINGMVFLGELR